MSIYEMLKRSGQTGKTKRLECLYCHRVALWTSTFKIYVCDDCYAKGLGRDKAPKNNFYGDKDESTKRNKR